MKLIVNDNEVYNNLLNDEEMEWHDAREEILWKWSEELKKKWEMMDQEDQDIFDWRKDATNEDTDEEGVESAGPFATEPLEYKLDDYDLPTLLHKNLKDMLKNSIIEIKTNQT